MAVTKIRIPKPPKIVKPKKEKGNWQQNVAIDVAAGKGPFRQRPTRTPGAGIGSVAMMLDKLPSATQLSPSAAAGATIATPAPLPGPAAAPAPAAPARDGAWWRNLYTNDPRFIRDDMALRGQQNTTGNTYGFSINRNGAGQALYRAPQRDTQTNKPVFDAQGNPVYDATGIIQTFDDAGNTVYRDDAGKVYPVEKLEMDIQNIKQGESGYLQGAMGLASAQSANRQFGIGDAAAQAGAGRSGMRAQGSLAEVSALKGALGGLATRSAGELEGIDRRYGDLYTEIFNSLQANAENLNPPPAIVTPDAPAAPTTGAGAAAGAATGSPNSWLAVSTAGIQAYTKPGTPQGSNVPKDPAIGRGYVGTGGVTWRYRGAHQGKPAGWYRR